MKFLKPLIFFIILAHSAGFSQQFKKVEIGVDGLTCSMCTRSVEMNIRKLDFVDSVKMDLTNTNGVVLFKKGATIEIEKIAKAVRDAGFSTRYLNAVFSFTSQELNNGSCFQYNGNQYKFIGVDNKKVSGETTLTFVGKDFMPSKQFKKWSESVKESCSSDKRTYYVKI